jgi:hypothetical protein
VQVVVVLLVLVVQSQSGGAPSRSISRVSGETGWDQNRPPLRMPGLKS